MATVTMGRVTLRCLRAIALAGGLLLTAMAAAEPVDVPKPDPAAKCPVCGMFVAKYPEWIATVVFKDGHAHHFDGPKDMFTFLFQLDRYAPGHGPGDIATIAVTDYYDVETIDARNAWFVVGSDVYGPMGHELVALQSAEDARAFSADHGGRGVYRFDQITPRLLEIVHRGAYDELETPEGRPER